MRITLRSLGAAKASGRSCTANAASATGGADGNWMYTGTRGSYEGMPLHVVAHEGGHVEVHGGAWRHVWVYMDRGM